MVHVAEFSFEEGEEQHNEVDTLGEADNDEPGSEVDCVEEKAGVGAFGFAEIEVAEVGVEYEYW